VDDIVAATRAAADNGRPGCVYNVGGGECVSINHVLELVSQVTSRHVAVTREETQRGDMKDTHADTTVARRDLGFRSTVALREGLAREWNWIRGQY
jgi:UDP-glucose 4-epimerase